jgi:TerC family integral membrane protein
MGVDSDLSAPLAADDSEPGRARAVSDITVPGKIDPNKVRNAMAWTLASFLLSNGIGLSFSFLHPRKHEAMMEFYAGYILELALSLDNLFAFYLVFKYFKVVSERAQNRVLFWGIVGAIVLRAVMVGLGAAAVATYRPILLLAAGFLLWTTYIVFFADEDDDEDIADNFAVKLAQKIVPVGERYHDADFVGPDGKATPLMLVLVTIEFSDVMFAFDSVPAIFGVTDDGYVVWAACMCAIMCLRSLYTLIVQFVADLEYMNKAIGLVLFFIAIKLLLDLILHVHVSITVSLSFVAGILFSGALLSIIFRSDDEEEDEEDAEAGNP